VGDGEDEAVEGDGWGELNLKILII